MPPLLNCLKKTKQLCNIQELCFQGCSFRDRKKCQSLNLARYAFGVYANIDDVGDDGKDNDGDDESKSKNAGRFLSTCFVSRVIYGKLTKNQIMGVT